MMIGLAVEGFTENLGEMKVRTHHQSRRMIELCKSIQDGRWALIKAYVSVEERGEDNESKGQKQIINKG